MRTVVTEVPAAPPIGAFPKGEIRRIPLELIDESPWNPRQYFPEKEMAELTDSMRQSGFREWLPMVVRPSVGGRFEAGAGYPRGRAARVSGLERRRALFVRWTLVVLMAVDYMGGLMNAALQGASALRWDGAG